MENTTRDHSETGGSDNKDKKKNHGNTTAERTNEEVQQVTDSIPGNQTDQPFTADDPDIANKPRGGRTFEETTDPSKLSKL